MDTKNEIIKEQKKELRTKVKEKISKLSRRETEESDKKILHQIKSLAEYKNADTIFCYVSTEKEINTIPLLQEILDSGKRLGVPKCTGKGIMDAYEIQNLEQLKDVDLVILQEIDRVQKDQILRYCATNGIEVYLKPEMEDVLMCSMKSVSVNGTMLLQIGNKNERPVYELVKRMMDICISVVGLVLASPVMLITAGLIKAQDRGTVLYSQKRLTKDGKIFEIYKFRSMKMDAEKDGKARLAEKSDDRITTVGKWIRMTRIDELPQFINVLRGDMSIVGPRPERPELAEKYTEENPEFAMRLKVKAGITGFAQVYGRYNTPAIEKAQMDAYYIRKASVLMDLRLILATVKVLFMKESSEGVVTESKTENRAENKAYKMIKERETA